MPKPQDKQLKAVVKSHYSHETRKDVNLAGLKSLRLVDAWPFIREEIEKEIGIGGEKLVCVPFITEARLYRITSVFLNSLPSSKLYTPVGTLSSIIDPKRSDPGYVEWLKSEEFIDNSFQFPHESVKITLQDEDIKNKVRVIMIHFSRLAIPKDKSPVNKLYLDPNNKDLKGLKSIFMITNVVMAKTVEFRANIGTSSRIFHLGDQTPLVFDFEEFQVDENGQIVSKVPTQIPSNAVAFDMISPTDNLLTASKENVLLKA